jgi:DHA1 family bicyclomycin/chloramphenicol resistance-like MFS transporter
MPADMLSCSAPPIDACAVSFHRFPQSAVTTLADWTPLALVISLLALGAFAFGLIAPNAMQGATQPLPQIAGAGGAATGCIQMATGAIVSELVATLNDEHSALSMTTPHGGVLASRLDSYMLIARPAERVVSAPTQSDHTLQL